MKIDVNKLSADEIFALLNELGPKAKELEMERKNKALESIKEIIDSNNLTKLDVLALFSAATTNSNSTVVYKHPTTGQTHSGRGRPSWIKEWIASGNKLEDLIVKDSTETK